MKRFLCVIKGEYLSGPQSRVWTPNADLHQRSPEGAGRGFNLGVDLEKKKKTVATVTFWHCDTFAVFCQRGLCYSLCFPTNNILFPVQ